MYVAAIHRPQITPLTDFTKFITNKSRTHDRLLLYINGSTIKLKTGIKTLRTT